MNAPGSLRARLRPTGPVLILGSVLMALGLLLSWPSLYGMWVYEKVGARIIDVFDQPHEDGVQICIVFDYRVDGTLLGEPDREYWCLGTQRCDVMGQPLPDLVVSDAAMAGDIRRRLLDRQRQRFEYAYYDQDEPFTSGRLFLPEGRTPLIKEFIGVILLCTPPIVWSLLVILAGFWPANRRR